MKHPCKTEFLSLSALKSCILFLCLLSACLVWFSGCGRSSAQSYSQTGFYLNTVISITIYEKEEEALLADCMELAGYYETLFSRTLEGSDIYRINHSNGEAVSVNEETVTLLETALSCAQQSNGLLDPTIGTLSSLWNFGDPDTKTAPPQAEIEEALSHVDYHTIQISGNQVSLSDPEAMLDLGFIAKGYIADRLKDYLLSQGVQNALINLGGNVLTLGERPDHTPFRIGIQDPFSDTGTPLTTLQVTDCSLVSSGNYERCFEENGILYHHILSTADGYPVNSGLAQVTILGSCSMEGDALSTLCFILGYEKGLALIESLPDTEAMFVTTEGAIYTTETFPASTAL